jgi:phosphopantothenoylcysteine decarboxylase
MNIEARQMSLTLAVVACAALPARSIQDFVILAQAADYDVWLIATPNALAFIDLPLLTRLTTHPIVSVSSDPNDNLPSFDVVVVVPATFNTLKKWAHQAPDTFALHFLLQAENLRLPILAVPRASTELAQDPAFPTSLALLRQRGIAIYYRPDLYPPNNNLPWPLVLDLLQK